MIEPDPITPKQEETSSRARRRRARRKVIAPLTPDEKTDYIQTVLRKASPTFDFFLFSFLSGAILGVGFIIDNPYFLLLGTLLAPLMSPVIGISLGTVLGSARFFGRSLGGLLIGGFLVIVTSALAGFATRLWPPIELFQVHLHSQLTWPPFIALGVGAVVTSTTLVKESHHSGIPSILLAYGLYLPLTAAGFGLGSGTPHLWPDGLVLFTIHLAWATLLGAITLAIMGFRPYTLFGYSLGGVIILLMVTLALGFFGAGAVLGMGVTLPTPTRTLQPSPTPSLTPGETPIPPPPSDTPTITPTPSLTPSITPTPSPTLVQALVDVDPRGAVLRDGPDGKVVSYLQDGSLVELTGETFMANNGRVWVHVHDLENKVEGWILQTLLITATPSTPLSPPTNTSTPPPTETATPTMTSSPTNTISP
jgi:hypothetical protein